MDKELEIKTPAEGGDRKPSRSADGSSGAQRPEKLEVAKQLISLAKEIALLLRALVQFLLFLFS